MGAVPPKMFMPSSPYGASQAANTLNPVQPAATSPQLPLLPPSFTDPGKMQAQSIQSTLTGGTGNNAITGGGGSMGRMFGRGLFGN